MLDNLPLDFRLGYITYRKTSFCKPTLQDPLFCRYDLNAVPESFEQSYNGKHKLPNRAIILMLSRELKGLRARVRDCRFRSTELQQKLREVKNKLGQV